jgi:hypothetical protein
MRTTDVPGIGLTLLCTNPTECRHHWPADPPEARINV